MKEIIIHQEKAQNPAGLVELCPFGAIEYQNQQLSISAACKMCGLCVKNGPPGVFEAVEERVEKIDKDQWQGIAIYIQHSHGEIHPVSFELIGKARELAAKIDHPVYALFMGGGIRDKVNELGCYGVDKIFVYDQPELAQFRVEPYAAVFEDFINAVKPSTVLVGGTTVGRSLAPRVAARFRTGLTADCTFLDMQSNTDLDQIRPAFGGNIMAHIRTTNSRPQFATVRYKIFSAPQEAAEVTSEMVFRTVAPEKLVSRVKVIGTHVKEAVEHLEDADVIIVAGRGVKKEGDMEMIQALADRLGAQIAGTRPLIEAGWVDPRRQIGLSGRTVSPKLIVTCGVSGAVQFTAGMGGAEHIVAINTDPNAAIFKTAHIGLVGDMYEIIPQLLERLENEPAKALFCKPVLAVEEA